MKVPKTTSAKNSFAKNSLAAAAKWMSRAHHHDRCEVRNGKDFSCSCGRNQILAALAASRPAGEDTDHA